MRCMILAATLLYSLSSIGQAAQIYKWVDAQGQTHFDAQPPVNQPVQQIDLKQTPAAPDRAPLPPVPGSAHSSDQDALDAKVKKLVAVQDAKRATYCEDVRMNIAQLRNNPRARMDVNGVVRRLTDEERETRIDQANKAIADNCQ